MKSVFQGETLPAEDLGAIQTALENLERDAEKIYDRKQQKIYRFKAAGRDLIAKTYRPKSFMKKLVTTCGFSRARRSFRAGLKLRKAGVKTPAPVLLVEHGALLLSHSTLVTDFCEGPSLRDLLETQSPLPDDLGKDLRKILLDFQSCGMRHGDFHTRNLIIHPSGDLFVIDLDNARVRFLNSALQRNLIEDRDRLVGSTEAFPEAHAHLLEHLGKPGTPLKS